MDIPWPRLHLPGGRLTGRGRLTVDKEGKTFDSSETPKVASSSYVYGKRHQKLCKTVLLFANLTLRTHRQTVEFHDAALMEFQLRYDRATWRCRTSLLTSNTSESILGLIGHCSFVGFLWPKLRYSMSNRLVRANCIVLLDVQIN